MQLRATDGRRMKVKRGTREESPRRNPDEHWDGVSGVYTVRSRGGAGNASGETRDSAPQDVVGIVCEPTS